MCERSHAVVVVVEEEEDRGLPGALSGLRGLLGLLGLLSVLVISISIVRLFVSLSVVSLFVVLSSVVPSCVVSSSVVPSAVIPSSVIPFVESLIVCLFMSASVGSPLVICSTGTSGVSWFGVSVSVAASGFVVSVSCVIVSLSVFGVAVSWCGVLVSTVGSSSVVVGGLGVVLLSELVRLCVLLLRLDLLFFFFFLGVFCVVSRKSVLVVSWSSLLVCVSKCSMPSALLLDSRLDDDSSLASPLSSSARESSIAWTSTTPPAVLRVTTQASVSIGSNFPAIVASTVTTSHDAGVLLMNTNPSRERKHSQWGFPSVCFSPVSYLLRSAETKNFGDPLATFGARILRDEFSTSFPGRMGPTFAFLDSQFATRA